MTTVRCPRRSFPAVRRSRTESRTRLISSSISANAAMTENTIDLDRVEVAPPPRCRTHGPAPRLRSCSAKPGLSMVDLPSRSRVVATRVCPSWSFGARLQASTSRSTLINSRIRSTSGKVRIPRLVLNGFGPSRKPVLLVKVPFPRQSLLIPTHPTPPGSIALEAKSERTRLRKKLEKERLVFW